MNSSIVPIFDEHGWDSKELSPKNNKNLPFCSAASSARLAFADISRRGDYKGVSFEEKLYNDFCTIAPTKMDVIINSICYECKCQEIVEGEGEVLRVSYLYHKKSRLFKEFNADKGYISIGEKRTKKGKLKYRYLVFSCRNLNIDIDKNYDELHFNLKQMICHLIAMANSEKVYDTLQYVIYVPKLHIIDKTPEIKQMYSELVNEVDKIFDGKTEVSMFAKRHGIELPKPIYKTIDDFQIVESFEEIYR